MNTPGENLKLMRELAGLSQSELAKAAGINWPQQISHLETGKRNMGLSLRKKLAKAFNMPIEEFTRMIHSEGDSDSLKLWLKISNARKDNDFKEFIMALSLFADLHEVSKSGALKDAYENLIQQIQINLKMSKINPSK